MITGQSRWMFSKELRWMALFFFLSAAGSGYAQAIEKITVPVVRQGDLYDFPFSGGLDAPQFSSVDLNFDGVQDVFVFDRQGYTAIPFVAVGEPGNYTYTVQWDLLEHLPLIQQWAVLYDFNHDGIEDLFCNTHIAGVQGIDVYRGRKNNNRLDFDMMQLNCNGFNVLCFTYNNNQDTTPLYSQWIDVPAIKDIDGDGDVDVLTFNNEGTKVNFYSNRAVQLGLGTDTLVMEQKDVCWGKFYEDAFSEMIFLSDSPGTCASGNIIRPRHSGSTLAAYDYDGDGDQDLMVGDLSSARIVRLTNGGIATQAWMTAIETQFPSNDVPVDIPFFVSPFSLDIDHDGVEDLVAASNNTALSENYDVAWYYKNLGGGDYQLQQTDLFVSEMLDFGSDSKPAFFDYNSDGLPDILIGTGGYYSDGGLRDPRLVLLENTGTPENPSFDVVDEDYLDFSSYASVPTWEFAPAAGDIDHDGDVDLVIGERNGSLFFVENIAGEGQPVMFANPVYPYANIFVGQSSTPDLIDLNGDGMLDLVVGERVGNNDNSGKCSNLNYFQNMGSPGSAVFSSDVTAAPNTQCLGRVLFGASIGLAENSNPTFIRTPDGLRLVIGSDGGQIRIYSDIEANVYGSFVQESAVYGNIRDGFSTAPALADLDQDGFYEMVLGNRRGGLTLYNTDLQTASTGLHDLSSADFIFAIPNPALGYVLVRAEDIGGSQNRFNLRIMDVSGRILKSVDQVIDGQIIDLPSEHGLYVLMLSDATRSWTQRIVNIGN